eukprot:234356_1
MIRDKDHVIMIILYLFCESLPNDNTLINSSIVREIITKGISLVLIVTNSIVVPQLVKSSTVLLPSQFIKRKSVQIVLFLRTVNILIVPVIASLFLLNDCGKWWTLYWIPCSDNNKHDVFDIPFTIPGLLDGLETQLQLSSSKDVCSPQPISSINWSKCIRSFFYRWTYVVMKKFMIMIVMPVCIIIFKIVKQTVMRKYNAWMGKAYKNTYQKMEIDSQYSMIITSFESVIAFSIISPLIIPIVLVAVSSNIFWHIIMINKLKWKLTTYKNNTESFPVHLLIIGMLCGQLFTTSFCALSVTTSHWFHCM